LHINLCFFSVFDGFPVWEGRGSGGGELFGGLHAAAMPGAKRFFVDTGHNVSYLYNNGRHKNIRKAEGLKYDQG